MLHFRTIIHYGLLEPLNRESKGLGDGKHLLNIRRAAISCFEKGVIVFVQLQDEEAFSQRQKLLEGMLSLKERESEVDLNNQLKTK